MSTPLPPPIRDVVANTPPGHHPPSMVNIVELKTVRSNLHNKFSLPINLAIDRVIGITLDSLQMRTGLSKQDLPGIFVLL